jgi:HTH-type transcriptional regulator/antitoxin HipB
MLLRTATDVGAVIRERRRALGLDQKSLAQKVGISRKWIIEIEKGKPRAALHLVLRTLEVLGVAVRIGDERRRKLAPFLPAAAVDLDAVIEAHRKPIEPRRPILGQMPVGAQKQRLGSAKSRVPSRPSRGGSR